MSWRRTGLTGTVVALLAVRPAFGPGPEVVTALLAATAMAGWAVLIGITYRRARGLRARPPQPGRRAIAAYAVVTVVFAIIGGMVVAL